MLVFLIIYIIRFLLDTVDKIGTYVRSQIAERRR